MIQSFADADTEALFGDNTVRRLEACEKGARKKLAILDAATSLNDLRSLRGNRLEALKGKRRGQFSIRINDQWRVCFRWKADGPHDVEVVDYH